MLSRESLCSEHVCRLEAAVGRTLCDQLNRTLYLRTGNRDSLFLPKALGLHTVPTQFHVAPFSGVALACVQKKPSALDITTRSDLGTLFGCKQGGRFDR
jgi:hypothetical protein